MSSLDLAVIGNCMISALVDRRAQIVWSCFPRFDGEPVFSALLDCPEGRSDDEQRGVFAIDMIGMQTCEQAYLENTAVLISTMTDSSGNILEITDFAPRFKHYDRTFRPPQLIRRVRPIKGRPRIRLRVRPHFSWGAQAPALTRGSNHMRFVGPHHSLRLTTDAPITYVAQERPFVVDRPLSFFFGEDEPLRSDADSTAREFLDQTVDFWRDWVRSLSIPFEWQEAVIRAAITLKLCNFEETGAIVAALTTSVPEAPHTQRNWDYRYLLAARCLFRHPGAEPPRHDRDDGGISYLHHQHRRRIGCGSRARRTCRRSSASPGRPSSRSGKPKRLPAIAAWDPSASAMRPIRKIQNDAYGSIVLASTHAFLDERMIRPGNQELFEHLETLGRRAIEVFDQPDAGPWELRTKAAVHTFPSVMCWAACDRLDKIAQALNRPGSGGFLALAGRSDARGHRRAGV